MPFEPVSQNLFCRLMVCFHVDGHICNCAWYQTVALHAQVHTMLIPLQSTQCCTCYAYFNTFLLHTLCTTTHLIIYFCMHSQHEHTSVHVVSLQCTPLYHRGYSGPSTPGYIDGYSDVGTGSCGQLQPQPPSGWPSRPSSVSKAQVSLCI